MCRRACVTLHHSLEMTVACLIIGFDREQEHFKPHSQRTSVTHGAHVIRELPPILGLSPKLSEVDETVSGTIDRFTFYQ